MGQELYEFPVAFICTLCQIPTYNLVWVLLGYIVIFAYQKKYTNCKTVRIYIYPFWRSMVITIRNCIFHQRIKRMIYPQQNTRFTGIHVNIHIYMYQATIEIYPLTSVKLYIPLIRYIVYCPDILYSKSSFWQYVTCPQIQSSVYVLFIKYWV